MGERINIGCGRSPTKGWRNFDNTFSIKLAESPTKFAIAKRLGFLSDKHLENIQFNRENEIEYADSTTHIPVPDNSASALYTSHMLEHIARKDAKKFLLEARRVLEDGGVLRVSVPDLSKAIAEYTENRDADRFMERILVTAPAFGTVRQKVSLFATGYRHHQWMYDGASLSKLMTDVGFRNVTVQCAGQTMIADPGELNLSERSEQSVYVEGVK